MSAKLYEFPVSHYCEKARWSLDYKGVAYRRQTLLPGLHIRQLPSRLPDSTVPVLETKDVLIQGSDQIINYLEQAYPDRPLTPTEPDLQQQSLEWEQFAATRIADPLRCFYYHYLLDAPKTLLPLFCANGPWYGPLVMKLGFRQLARRMRAAYQINQRTAQLAMRVVDKAIKKLESHLTDKPFLVGERFTRADLSVCALISPLVLPERGFIKSSVISAQALLDYRKTHSNSPVFRWVNAIYNTYR